MRKVANIICIILVLISVGIEIGIYVIQLGDPTILIIYLIGSAVLFAIYYYIKTETCYSLDFRRNGQGQFCNYDLILVDGIAVVVP